MATKTITKERLKEMAEKMFPYGYSTLQAEHTEYIGLIKIPIRNMEAILGIGNNCAEGGDLCVTCFYWGDEKLVEPFGYVLGVIGTMEPDLEPMWDEFEPHSQNLLEFRFVDK